MNILLNIFISGIVALGSFVGAYKYLPLNYFESPQKFGSTITTIAGTDTLSSSRTTINTNFSNLNNGKVEISDLGASTTMPQITTLVNLAAVGTITSGTWSGTAILSTKGGTGSTTLSSGQILLGNGTGNIGVVSGWGSSGQFLTSGGGTSAPTWTTSSIDQAANYTWTGSHTFATTTQYRSNMGTLVATTSATVNNLTVTGTFSASGASNTEVLLVSTTTEQAMTFATTTFTAYKYLRMEVYVAGRSQAATYGLVFSFNSDFASNYGEQFSTFSGTSAHTSNSYDAHVNTGPATTSPMFFEGKIYNASAVPKLVRWSSVSGTGVGPTITAEGSALWQNTSAQINQIIFGVPNDGTLTSGSVINIYGHN